MLVERHRRQRQNRGVDRLKHRLERDVRIGRVRLDECGAARRARGLGLDRSDGCSSGTGWSSGHCSSVRRCDPGLRYPEWPAPGGPYDVAFHRGNLRDRASHRHAARRDRAKPAPTEPADVPDGHVARADRRPGHRSQRQADHRSQGSRFHDPRGQRAAEAGALLGHDAGDRTAARRAGPGPARAAGRRRAAAHRRRGGCSSSPSGADGCSTRRLGVDAAIGFVRDSLLPQDQVAVAAYNRATDFTTDRAKILKVLERVQSQARADRGEASTALQRVLSGVQDRRSADDDAGRDRRDLHGRGATHAAARPRSGRVDAQAG